MTTNTVEAYYNSMASDYFKFYQPEKLTYKHGIGDYFRLQIVLRLLARARARSVFEVGVGDGTPLQYMHMMGMSVAGCDVSPNMVETARKRLHEAGLKEPSIFKADICNGVDMAPALVREPADAVIALGVMPHVEKDLVALQNMRALVRDGGKLLIEFRNALFSLFTFNRYTHDFIVDELLAPVSMDIKAKVSERLKTFLRMDLPPIKSVAPDGVSPGYDAIRAKFHNPFEVPKLLDRAGFRNPTFHWYHFHASMPMIQNDLGDTYDAESVAMEHELANDWRGYFLCSAVLVEADAV